MKCSNCGNELTGIEKFCDNCGAKVEKEEVIIQEENKVPEEVTTTEINTNEVINNEPNIIVESTDKIEENFPTDPIANLEHVPTMEFKEEVKEEMQNVETAVDTENNQVQNLEINQNLSLSDNINQEIPVETNEQNENMTQPVEENNNVQQPIEANQPTVNTNANQSPEKKNNVGLIIAIILLIIAVAGGGFLGGYFFFGEESKTEEKDEDKKEDNDDEKEENKDFDKDNKNESTNEVTIGSETITFPEKFGIKETEGGTQVTNGEWFGIILENETSYELSKENIDVYISGLEDNGYNVISNDEIQINGNDYIEIELEQNNMKLVILMTDYNGMNLMITLASIDGSYIDEAWYEEYDEILENSKEFDKNLSK